MNRDWKEVRDEPVALWGKGIPGKEKSTCSVSESGVSLACVKNTKKPVGLEWNE